MTGPEEWRKEFIPLEAELDALSRISAAEWAGNFAELEAELDRMRTFPTGGGLNVQFGSRSQSK